MLVFLISCDDRVSGDRAGVGGEFIPPRLCTGHIKIRGDFQSFLGDSFGEHRSQAGQFQLMRIKVVLHRSQLLHSAGNINLREHGFDFGFRQSTVQQALNLCQQADIFNERILVHAGSELVEIGKQAGLFGFRSHAVLAQLLVQGINICSCLLDVFLFPHRESNLLQERRIFQRSLPTLGIIALIQVGQRSLPFSAIGDQLDKRILLVVVRINLLIDRRQALCRRNDSVFIHGNVGVTLPACLRTGNLGFQLLTDGLKALGVAGIRHKIVPDLNGFTSIYQLL